MENDGGGEEDVERGLARLANDSVPFLETDRCSSSHRYSLSVWTALKVDSWPAILDGMFPIVYFAIPAVLALVLLERAWLSRAKSVGEATPFRGYFEPDTRASLLMGLANSLIAIAVGVFTFALYTRLYAHRLFEPGTGWQAFLLLFIVEDLTYYAWHRASHEVRLLWAAHENHHSSEYFNLSTALRQSRERSNSDNNCPLAISGLAFAPSAPYTLYMIGLASQSTDAVALMQTVGTVAGGAGGLGIAMIIVGLIGTKAKT